MVWPILLLIIASLFCFITTMWRLGVLESLDEIIDIEVAQPASATQAQVDELLREVQSPSGFIPAIKAYRALTNAGFKEAKEAIEKYRVTEKSMTAKEFRNKLIASLSTQEHNSDHCLRTFSQADIDDIENFINSFEI